MRLSHKLGKVLNGRAYESVRQRTRRAFLRRRKPRNLDVAQIIATIDPEKFEKIRANYGIANPGEEPPKYLELPRWIDANLRRVSDLELDRGARKRVLDIGSGSGYFLYICRLLDHDAIGIDLDNYPMFTETTELLGVQRSIWRVVVCRCFRFMVLHVSWTVGFGAIAVIRRAMMLASTQSGNCARKDFATRPSLTM